MQILLDSILTLITFTPLVGAILVLFLPLPRISALIITVVTFILSIYLYSNFNLNTSALQFVEKSFWIPSLGINYLLAVDGFSLVLIILTTFLMPIIVLASNSVTYNIRFYLASMLLLESAMLGTLLALDLFLFYIFWELMLAPMYLIIGVWGGKRKIYASIKFVLYTLVGSLLMLVAIIYIVWRYYQQTGEMSFLLADLLTARLTDHEELWLFGAFAVAFGIKVPVFPFHTWLPDAHVEAPTGGSVVLAGVLLKMGIYGFLRFAYPLFPRAAETLGPLILVLALIGIVYGALVAWRQDDIKKLVAYSSVSHLGFCVLGLVALNLTATTGLVFQMLSHGITTGALFLMVGVLYDRKHTRLIADYGGLASKMPLFSLFLLLFTMGSMAVPLTSGFVGEFMILLGSYQAFSWLAIIAASGVVLGALYMLTLYLKVVFGKLDQNKNSDLMDLNFRELAFLTPLVIVMFVIGIYPKPCLEVIEPASKSYLQLVTARKDLLNRGLSNLAYKQGEQNSVN